MGKNKKKKQQKMKKRRKKTIGGSNKLSAFESQCGSESEYVPKLRRKARVPNAPTLRKRSSKLQDLITASTPASMQIMPEEPRTGPYTCWNCFKHFGDEKPQIVGAPCCSHPIIARLL